MGKRLLPRTVANQNRPEWGGGGGGQIRELAFKIYFPPSMCILELSLASGPKCCEVTEHL